jgi:ribonuclease P protein subunit POP4
VTPISRENLIRHELIGLPVRVTHSSNPAHMGIEGKVIDETKNMLMISDGVKKKWIQKYAAVYCFSLPDKSTVEVRGEEILGRPVKRLKKSSKRFIK